MLIRETRIKLVNKFYKKNSVAGGMIRMKDDRIVNQI